MLGRGTAKAFNQFAFGQSALHQHADATARQPVGQTLANGAQSPQRGGKHHGAATQALHGLCGNVGHGRAVRRVVGARQVAGHVHGCLGGVVKRAAGHQHAGGFQAAGLGEPAKGFVITQRGGCEDPRLAAGLGHGFAITVRLRRLSMGAGALPQQALAHGLGDV